MSFDALRRTIRRCTAVVVAILGIGFGEVAAGFDGTPLVVGALIYLVASALFGAVRLYRRYKATASGLDPEGEANNFPVFYNERAVAVAPPDETDSDANGSPSS